MKKFWSTLLICFLTTTSFGTLVSQCTTCTSALPTHCKQAVSEIHRQPSCHHSASVETTSCCPSDKQITQSDCQLCSGHDQPVTIEKAVETQIQSTFQFEGLLAETIHFSRLFPTKKPLITLDLSGSPSVTSLTFLRTVRLLC